MFKLLSYAIIGAVLYFLGNLVHDRYVYISDRRDWLEQANAMSCTPEDNARLLAQLKSELLGPIRQRTAGKQAPLVADIEFVIAPFREQRMSGEPFGLRLCTKDNFPWRQRKGGMDDSKCSMPAYLHCKANVLVKVPSELIKEADIAARYLPLRGYGGGDPVTDGGKDYEVFQLSAGLSKTVPRFARTRLYLQDQIDGKAHQEFEFYLANLDGIFENWLQFHEKQEELARNFQVANDIGGAIGGGGYIGSINKLRSQQVQLNQPASGQ